MKHTPARTCPSWHEAYMVVGIPPSEGATYLGCDDFSHWRRLGMPWNCMASLGKVRQVRHGSALRGDARSEEKESHAARAHCHHHTSPKDCRGLNGLVGLEPGPGDPFVRVGLTCCQQAQVTEQPPAQFVTHPAQPWVLKL